MEAIGKVLLFVSVCGATGLAAGGGKDGQGLVFRGASDASAAVAVGQDLFIVADDENNVLRVYRTDKPGMPAFSYDLTGFLGIEPEHPEADIEGAAKVGSRIYWVTSHGRNKDGKMRPNRYRFFATDVHVGGDAVFVRPVGAPCTRLVHELLKIANSDYFGFRPATRFGTDLKKKEREKLAPKKKGLNIEALCASSDGKTIYIGFRNPKVGHGSKAIVVPLRNADRVVERADAPAFSEPVLWDLAGLGIRSMEYSRFHEALFVVAGSHDEDGQYALYRWSGERNAPPVWLGELSWGKSKFTPEALAPFADGRLLLFSDDGSLPITVDGPADCLPGEYGKDGTCPNKYLANPEKKTFRAVWLELPDR
ncbi:MAG: DUF3616 domain-containing protein [Planctomycetota bacterium]|jgi:hypothetical protein